MSTLISTRDENKEEVSYTYTLLKGLASDGGLYVPSKYPILSYEELRKLSYLDYSEIAFYIKRKFIGNDIPEDDLRDIVKKSYSEKNFKIDNGLVVPTKLVDNDIFLENLSLGPTAAFKDLALQQLGQEMNYELSRRNQYLEILGATSGDTGSASEAAIKGLDRIKLFMLSPQVGMSEFQRAQMGKLTGGNIFNLSVEGMFDNCQDLVKKLKQDSEFSNLGAVNSINWGRISSQVPYFVSGYLQVVSEIGQEVDFVVPTGNFGNILSGYIARQMGLPIRKLIVATNENDVMAKLIEYGIYETNSVKITSSPSMDISKASNYERLLFEILDNNPKAVREYMEIFEEKGKVDISEFGVQSDVFKKMGFFQGTSNHEDRINTIRNLYKDKGIIIDPHTANGLKVALEYKKEDNVPMIVTETALPVKFEGTIKEALGFVPDREERFRLLEDYSSENCFYNISTDAEELKEYIRKNR